MKLEDAQIADQLARVPEWTLDGKTISRRYKFPSFLDSMAFANQVADIAERRNHHPFISIDFKVVTLRLTSWHAGGLTHQDFDEAVEVDAVYTGPATA